MLKKLAIMAFFLMTMLVLLSSGAIAHADELQTLSDSTKIYDIVQSPWTMAKKAEIAAAIDLVKGYDALDKMKWYNVVGYYNISKQINEKRKVFYEASKQRILLEEKMKREGTKDFGQSTYNAIISGADIWARYASKDGPIFSQLISSYDNMLLKITEYDELTWMNPFKKTKKLKEVKDSTKSVVECAKRFEQSNTFATIKSIIDLPQGKGVINTVTGIGGIINSIGGIFKQITSIGGALGGVLSSDSRADNGAAPAEEAVKKAMPVDPEYSASGRVSADVKTDTDKVFAPSSAEFYTQKHQEYIKLVEQYYEALKAGKSTEELSGQLEEINKLKKELKIK